MQAEWQLLEALAGEALDAQEVPECGAISVMNVTRCGAPAEEIRVAAAEHVATVEARQAVRGGKVHAARRRSRRWLNRLISARTWLVVRPRATSLA